jgi:general secretion pathway protein C
VTIQSLSLPGRKGGRNGLPRGFAWGLGVLEIALLAALTYLAARLIWLIAFGASATNFERDPAAAGAGFDGRPAYQADLSRLSDSDLFADRRAAPADAAPVRTTVQETRLDLTLRGIRRGASPQAGGAIIQTPDNRQRFFAAGQEILDGVTLEEVHVDHVLIRRRGIAESLYLRGEDQARRAAATPSASTAASGRGTEIPGLFRAEPVREGDRLTGYRIAAGHGAMLSAMGLRDGDVITAIDGRPAADIADMPALFRSLREEGGFTLSINRGGLPLTVQVDLP